jgi:DnaJ-domain-containing protein 1
MLRAVASLSSSAVGRPVVPACARRAQKRGTSARARAARLRARGAHATWDSSSETHSPSHSVATAFFDAYAALEIPDDASSTQIRASYVALQKKFHPDVYAGDDASKRSSDVNRAYEILVDDVKRANLDAAIRRLGKTRRREDSATLIPATGIVGPLRAALLHKMDVCGAEVHGLEECEADVVWRMTESIREWGKMLAFTSELPLPLPLQCDDVENGVRLAMVTFENSVVREVGALVITCGGRWARGRPLRDVSARGLRGLEPLIRAQGGGARVSPLARGGQPDGVPVQPASRRGSDLGQLRGGVRVPQGS